MFLGLDSYDKIQETFILAKSMFGEVLSGEDKSKLKWIMHCIHSFLSGSNRKIS